MKSNKVSYKESITVKDYTVDYRGYSITVPKGSTFANKTACGNDDHYRFVKNISALAIATTGHHNSMLLHDLTYYGLNIPIEFCEPYKE